MCDTLVALPAVTGSGDLILAKNSDREPNEAQAIERIPARRNAERMLACTYIQVPQVAQTYEVLLSRPFHMWGAEMGVNEHGVAIGNEAVFTRVHMPHRNIGLTGMDLLRLALERTRSAEAALEVITALLEEYGQNACGGYENRRFFYHNSFLIADTSEAWVLETAGRHWVARRVTDRYGISNGLTIEDHYDRSSGEAVDYAYRQGWLRNTEPFNFRKAYSDWFFTRMSSCHLRRRSTENALDAAKAFDLDDAIATLSAHHLPDDQFSPHRATTADVCMHATGLTNPSQTTGSMVAHLRRDGPPTVWLTGSSMPCLSVYLPFFFGGTTLSGPDWRIPGARPDDSLWWRAERLHRRIGKDYQQGRALIANEREAFQQDLIVGEADLIARGATTTELDAFSRQALHRYASLLEEWLSRLDRAGLRLRSRNPMYWLYRRRRDRRLGEKG